MKSQFRLLKMRADLNLVTVWLSITSHSKNISKVKSSDHQGCLILGLAVWYFIGQLSVECLTKGRTIIFSPEGYRDWEKIVCMRKIAEINYLPQRCIQKKLSAEATPVMGNLGNLKKNCLHSELRKKFASAQSMLEKNFLPPGNRDISPGEK